MVPFLDLKRIHEPLLKQFSDTFNDLVMRSAFVNGAEVRGFEENFAKWVGTKYCVGVSSGLDAEVIALRSMGINPGDKVVTQNMTFIATTEAITQIGAIPVLVDVDTNGMIDMEQTEAAVKAGAKGVLPVHLFGQMVDPGKLTALKTKYGVKILEDACQSHGAVFNGVRAGTVGQTSAFSFYPGKNLGALGDGGALCTNDETVVTMAKALREHGQTKKYYHDYEGYTARLDNIQAAFLTIKLKEMDKWNTQRIEAAKYYYEHLQGLKNFRTQAIENTFDGRHVFHLFIGLTPKRQALADEFTTEKIGFGFHYPITINKLACYQDRTWNKTNADYPNSNLYAEQGISLPMFPGITKPEQDVVIKAIRKICG